MSPILESVNPKFRAECIYPWPNSYYPASHMYPQLSGHSSAVAESPVLSDNEKPGFTCGVEFAKWDTVLVSTLPD